MTAELLPTVVVVAPNVGTTAYFSPPESVEQASVVRWLRSAGVRHHSIPNSAATSRTRGATMKREGLSPGVPDLFIYTRTGLLALEMKRADGRLSDLAREQVDWLNYLSTFPGIVAAVAFGADAAIGLIRGMVRGTVDGP